MREMRGGMLEGVGEWILLQSSRSPETERERGGG